MNYWIIVNGQQKGPFTIEQLRWQKITPQTDVWGDGMPNWTKASQVPELQSLFTAGAAQPSQQAAAPQQQQTQQQYQQQQTQQQYQQPQQQSQQQISAYPPNSHVAESILVMLFCCMPFGIVALVHATMVRMCYDRGDYTAAMQHSQTASKWLKIGFFIGLAVIVLYAILVFVVGVSIFNGAKYNMWRY